MDNKINKPTYEQLEQREHFEAWVMTQVCIAKATLEGLRTDEGYRNSTLSGADYNRMWLAWQAASQQSEAQVKQPVTDAMALAFHAALSDGSIGSDDVEEIKTGLRAALANYIAQPAPAQPVAWTDEEELREVSRVGFGEMFSVEPISPNADMCRVIPLYREAPPAPAPVTVKLPPLNDDLASILGRPNFTCSHLAELFRKSGEEIPRKSEREQAAVIYWLLGLYLEHGDKWEDIAKADIQSRVAGIKIAEGE